jgi:hypothetical protein
MLVTFGCTVPWTAIAILSAAESGPMSEHSRAERADVVPARAVHVRSSIRKSDVGTRAVMIVS